MENFDFTEYRTPDPLNQRQTFYRQSQRDKEVRLKWPFIGLTMDRSRLQKLTKDNIARGRREWGRPLKRLMGEFWGQNRSTLAYTKFSGTTILMSTNPCAFVNLWLASVNRNCVMYPSAISSKCLWHMHVPNIVTTLRCRVLLLL